MSKLFLIPRQGEIFLTLLCVGLALGAAWQALSFLRRRWPRLAFAWDALFALSLLISLLGTLLKWREEQLRLYALLGLTLGSSLYLAGPGSLLRAVCRVLKNFRAVQEKPKEKAN